MKSRTNCGLILSIVSMLFCAPASAQSKSSGVLSVGDKLPDIFISHILNSEKLTRKIQDESGKALIIDFWSPYCGYSVGTFKLLDSIQLLYHQDLEIIRVTRHSEQDLRKLFARSAQASKSKLPLVYSDSDLRKFFPIELPHQVWIDKNGVIRAVANPQNFTAENVGKLVRNESINLMPMDHFQDFDPTEPLFVQAKMSFLDNVRQFSYYTRYINGINPKTGMSVDPVTKKLIRRAYYNMPVKNLIKLAYDNFGSGGKYGALSDNKRIIYERDDPENFFAPEDNNELIEWQWSNTYCYEIQVLPENAEKLALLMQQDIQRFFKVNVSEEIRLMDGYALVIRDRNKIPLSSGKGRSLTLLSQKTGISILENQPISELVKSVSGKLKSAIVVDETNFPDRIQLEYKTSTSVSEMKEQLNGFGFDLIPKKIEVQMLVVR